MNSTMFITQKFFFSVIITTFFLMFLLYNNPEIKERISYHKANQSDVVLVSKLVKTGDYNRINVITSPIPTMDELINKLYWVQNGGHWNPPVTKTNQSKIAIIVPFRNREEQLPLFLQHMHPFLTRQSQDYTIFVTEQNGNETFNKGIIMDAAFLEILKMDEGYDCFIFHDVDLLPEDLRHVYGCADQPRHLTVAVNTMKYKLQYKILIGGALAVTREQFEKANGYSTAYWGWGAEDDDMYYRLTNQNYTISRDSPKIARYTMLKHKKRSPNKDRHKLLQERFERFEGLNNVNYTLVDIVKKELYTWILIDPPSPPSTPSTNQ